MSVCAKPAERQEWGAAGSWRDCLKHKKIVTNKLDWALATLSQKGSP